MRSLLVGLLRGAQHHLRAVGIDADRLFHEDVLAGLDRRVEMKRTEPGRRGEDDDIHTRDGQNLLVGIEADEFPFVGNLDFRAVLSPQFIDGTVSPVLEHVADGHEFDVWAGH